MADRPNIVWIYCDELRTDALGCYGHPTARIETPHLDRLAESGAIFRHCFTNSPICVSARVAVLSGLYPEQTGVYCNEGAWDDFRLSREVETFPQMLANAGYATADFGKIHIPDEIKPFQHHHGEGGGMQPIAQPVRQRGWEIIAPSKVSTMIGGRFPGGEPYPAEKVTDNALAWMARRDGPFLARLSYLQPHTPVFPPPPYDTLYAGEPFRREYTERDAPRIERRFAEITGPDELTDEQIYLTQQYYYGLVRWVDDQVGRVVEGLRQSGRFEQTMIVFHADHGASLGEGACFAKHTFAPQVHRVPMIVHWPAGLAPSERDDVCQSIDLAPTVLGACGLSPTDEMRGRDLINDPPPGEVYATIGFGLPDSLAYPNARGGTWTDGTGWPRRTCVRTERYRLDCNVRRHGQPVAPEDRDVFLADYRDDPLETTNLADRPEHAELRRELEAKVDAHAATGIEPAAVRGTPSWA